MGIANAHAGRRGVSALILMATIALLIMVAFMAVSASIGAQDAQALPTFTDAVGGIGPCQNCHPKTQTHTQASHAAVYPTCSNCHPGGDTALPPLPSKCGVCHGGVTSILKSASHVTTKCGTTTGCHGYTAPPASVTTTLTAKVAPTSVKVKKSVKVTGTAGPAASLSGAKVAWKVERKVGAKWTKMKAGTATASPTGAFTVTYKAVKKGAHRVTLSIKATTAFTAKTLTKTFKVK
jgi:hypothetical protein